MKTDGIDPRDVAATLGKMAGKTHALPGFGLSKTRSTCTAIAGAAVADGKQDVSVEMPGEMTTGWNARMLRNNLRLASALVEAGCPGARRAPPGPGTPEGTRIWSGCGALVGTTTKWSSPVHDSE
jgi:hypothetical protein